jgi:uncharacterized protein (DUF433 family)
MAELDADDQRRIIEALRYLARDLHHRSFPVTADRRQLLWQEMDRCLQLAQTLSDSMPATMASGITVTTTPELGTQAWSMNSRITHNPDQCGGRPCIRGMRIRVQDILELYASGMTSEQILADFPDLEAEDLTAALAYAARQIDHPVLVG